MSSTLAASHKCIITQTTLLTLRGMLAIIKWIQELTSSSGKAYEDRIADIIAKLGQNWNEEFKALIDGDDDNYSTRAWLMHTDPK